jgi:hypothetical protein
LASLDAWLDDDPMVNEIQTLSEKIRQRRTQMLVHSYLYYVLDQSTINDGKWQQWADELVELQKQKKVIGFYDEAFSDWTGATGMHLPFDPWVIRRSKKILDNQKSV